MFEENLSQLGFSPRSQPRQARISGAADAGVPKLDTKDRDLLKAQNIGPVFMTDLESSLVINP
ncbi:hypothetical protein [Sphingobacterium puteale]|uniref:hypothetical protein n=1 Tax=Sphingobacterium puteale TaxID=2420510 RepID=UPI003D98F4B0